MKRLLVICDGAAEGPLDALGGRTPLQAASMPTLSALALAGREGTLCTCPDGVSVGSDTAILSILGADPRVYRPGRAALEALDAGIRLLPGQMAVRANLVSFNEDGTSLQKAHALQGKAALKAVQTLLDDGVFSELLSQSHAVLHPRPNSVQLLTMPARKTLLSAPHEHLGEPISAILPEDPFLRSLTLRAKGVLGGQNLGLWFWAAGVLPPLPPFPLPAVMISATPVCRGIGTALGMEVPRIPGATGGMDTDYGAKASAAIAAFAGGFDFVTVHLEAPDTCSHLKDLPGKLQSLSDLDRGILAPLTAYLQKASEPWRILVLSDHRTGTVTGLHEPGPVPYVCFDSKHLYPAGDTALALLGI